LLPPIVIGDEGEEKKREFLDYWQYWQYLSAEERDTLTTMARALYERRSTYDTEQKNAENHKA
jgi:hypothetical protein